MALYLNKKLEFRFTVFTLYYFIRHPRRVRPLLVDIQSALSTRGDCEEFRPPNKPPNPPQVGI